MSEMKPTPGPWVVEKRDGDEWWFGGHDGAEIVVRSVDDPNGAIAVMGCSLSRETSADNDFRLIAEAGTVFHECGLSPRQLVEMVKELKAALKEISEIEDQMYGADWEEIEEARGIAVAALTKASASTGKGVE